MTVIFEIGLSLFLLGIIYGIWLGIKHYVKEEEYFSGYRIGKLINHAKEKNVPIILEKRKRLGRVEWIDIKFEEANKEEKELEKQSKKIKRK